VADDSPPPARRSPGRPRAAEDTVCARIRLPVSDYDKVCRIAFRQDESVSMTLRGLIVVQLRQREPSE